MARKAESKEKGLNMKYKCICCSTYNNPVFITPVEGNNGYLHCPFCGSIELESQNIKQKKTIP